MSGSNGRAVRWTPWLALVVYAIAAAVLVRGHLYKVNPDGISYITIAQKYLAGDYRGAVNGYWAPLWSWLLVPWLATGVDPVWASKGLQIVIAVAFLGVVWQFGRRVGLSTAGRVAVQYAAALMALMYTFQWVTPDLLLMVMLLGYVTVLLGEGYPRNAWTGVLVGLLAGAAYLTKSYALPFCLAHLVVVTTCLVVLEGDRTRRWAVVRAQGVAVVATLLVAVPWAAVISHKYGWVTTGTSGAYNFKRDGPEMDRHWVEQSGLLPPTNATAVSSREDPTYLPLPSWSPLASWANFTYLIKQVLGNIRYLFRALMEYSLLAPVILVAAVFAWGKRTDEVFRRRLIILGSVVAIYPLGYLFLHVENRFFWVLGVVVLAFGALLAERAGRWRTAALVAVAGSFAIPGISSAWLNRYESHEQLVKQAWPLQRVVPARARWASDSHWRESEYLSFFVKGRYYGSFGPGSAETAARQLREQRVEYLMVWDEGGKKPYLEGAQLITNGPAQPRVYRLGVAGSLASDGAGGD